MVLKDQHLKGKIMALGDDQWLTRTQSLITHSGLFMYNTPAFARLKNKKNNVSKSPIPVLDLDSRYAPRGPWIQSEEPVIEANLMTPICVLFMFVVHRYF